LGYYEEEVNSLGKVRKIHYLSGAILIQNEGKADSLLYTYSDAQGSLIALTDENGVIARRYAYDPWGVRRDADNWNAKDNGVNLIVNRGYTGHEHLDAFGIINMNGRVYDPLTAQFFSPDQALDGSNWVSYNRYGYCLGNPFRYNDPTGNNPFLLGIAAVIGGVVNLGIQMISGNIHNAGDFFMAFGVGALAGLTGSWVGTLTGTALGVSAGIGALNGAIVGAGAGAAGGFIGGAGNAWMNGASFGDGLMAGLKGGGIGALTGGIIGGITTGISVTNHGGDFLSGKGANFDQVSITPETDEEITVGDGMEYNNEYAEEYSDDNFGKIKGLDNLHADATAPNGYTVKSNGTIYNPNGQQVNGVTHFNGKGYDVFLGKNVFVSKYNLFLTLGHEYTHIALNLGERVRYFDNDKAHAITDMWEYQQMNAWGMTDTALKPYWDAHMISIGNLDFNIYNRYRIPIITSSPKVP